MDSLREELNELEDCDLIVIDTFSAFFSILGFKDQNNQNDVQNSFNILTDVAKSNKQAILLLHHLDKKGESLWVALSLSMLLDLSISSHFKKEKIKILQLIAYLKY